MPRPKSIRPPYDAVGAFSQLLLRQRLHNFARDEGFTPEQNVSAFTRERFVRTEALKGIAHNAHKERQRLIHQITGDLRAAEVAAMSYRLHYSPPTFDREEVEKVNIPNAVATRVVVMEVEDDCTLWAKVGLVRK